jgi:hypothetical protein
MEFFQNFRDFEPSRFVRVILLMRVILQLQILKIADRYDRNFIYNIVNIVATFAKKNRPTNDTLFFEWYAVVFSGWYAVVLLQPKS